jgi:undecaprenyl-diphosphatase
MIAASGYGLIKHGLIISGSEIILLTLGFLTSFIVALMVIKFLIKYIKLHNFTLFAYYRIILGVFVLIYFYYL